MANSIRIRIVGIPAMSRALLAKQARALKASYQIAKVGGERIKGQAMRSAPKKSGALRGDIQVFEIVPYGLGARSKTGPTTLPYARRIELGFHGRDSIGRTYKYGGHPYLSPALQRVAPKIVAIAQKEWAKAWK